MMTLPKKIVLLDQDGVLADFEGGFLTRWQERHSKIHPGIPIAERDQFHIRGQYPAKCVPKIVKIQTEQGFFTSLKPMPGAIDAANALLQSYGYDVFICTSPLTGNRWCPSEKMEWVEEHMGDEWVRRVILTKDKTMVHGTVLVDDKPNIDGCRTPDWTHVMLDAPYNRTARRLRTTWKTYHETLVPLIEALP